MEVHELVCPVGADAFRIAGRAWPCGSRWISPESAAAMLGVPVEDVTWQSLRSGLPTNFKGWIGLDWVITLVGLQQRHRNQAS